MEETETSLTFSLEGDIESLADCGLEDSLLQMSLDKDQFDSNLSSASFNPRYLVALIIE